MLLHPTVIASHHDSARYWGIEKGYRIVATNLPPNTTSRFDVIGFQGAGLIRNNLVRDAHSANHTLTDVSDWDTLCKAILHSTGAFTLQVRDNTDQSVAFLNDPLGSGIILSFQNASFEAFGVDITSLRNALRNVNTTLDREPLFELARFATGTACYGSDTPFRNVTALSPGFGIHVHPDGNVSKVEYGVATQKSELQQLETQDLIQLGVGKIKENLEAVANSGEQEVYADITGGFDSRLLLAGLDSKNLQESVTLTSIRNAPEWHFAVNLAHVTDFKLTDQRFRGPSPISPPSFFESQVAGARSSGGILDNGFDPLTIPTPIITLQGGFGETFRTFTKFKFTNAPEFKPTDFSAEMWKWTRIFRLNIDGKRVIKNTLLEELSGRITRFIEPAVQSETADDYLPNHLYLNSRNRYWIGQQSFWRSQIQTRLDPLYNLPLIAAAEKLDFWSRRANLIGLDAMRLLSPDLLSYPFFNRGVISSRYEDARGAVPRWEFPGTSKNHLTINFPGTSEIKRVNVQDIVTDDDVSLARSLGISPINTSGLRTWGPRVYDAIRSSPTIRDYFDDQGLQKLLTNPSRDRGIAEAATKLIGSSFRSGLVFPDDTSLEDRSLFFE